MCICRQEIEQLADFYAIIRTMEKLEKQYIRGTIRASDYEKVSNSTCTWSHSQSVHAVCALREPVRSFPKSANL